MVLLLLLQLAYVVLFIYLCIITSYYKLPWTTLSANNIHLHRHKHTGLLPWYVISILDYKSTIYRYYNESFSM